MMVRPFRKLAAAMAMLVITALPAAAQVPDPYARQLAQQLANGEQVLSQNGYGRVAGPFPGGLAQREVRRFNVTLRAGENYRIVGVCDNRCSDLDLRLYDPNDTLLAEDVLDDDVPIISARPRTTGQHTIEVTMFRCTANPCYFAFNVYAGGNGGGGGETPRAAPRGGGVTPQDETRPVSPRPRGG